MLKVHDKKTGTKCLTVKCLTASKLLTARICVMSGTKLFITSYIYKKRRKMVNIRLLG